MKGIKNMLLGIVLIILSIWIHFIAEHGGFFTDALIPIAVLLVCWGYAREQ